MVTELRGEQLVLRPIAPGDEGPLKRILATPEVAEWWGPEPPGFPFDDEPQSPRFAIVVDNEVAGLIQFTDEKEPDYRHAAIDLYLDPALHNRGLGTDAVCTLVRHLLSEHGHHRVTIDPAVENKAAVRAYEKAGFRPVGVMRLAERVAATGRWRDSLFMELVRPPR